jgi:hypothetical protein
MILLTFQFSYCEDLVRKRLHNDVMPLIDAMRSGFNLVSSNSREYFTQFVFLTC